MSGSINWLAPDPQQRRLMYARALLGQQPQSSGWGNAGPPAPLPVMTTPSQGAALAQTGQQFMDWRAQQRAANVAAGLLDPDTGLPTAKGWQEAGRSIATGMGPSDIGVPGGMVGAIKAYHGSPYSFERFDLSKIGTGEGAQAFGHGLYFAESPGVAQSYRDKLTTGITYDGQPFFDTLPDIPGAPHAAGTIQSAIEQGKTPEAAINQEIKDRRRQAQNWQQASIDAAKRQPDPAWGDLGDPRGAAQDFERRQQIHNDVADWLQTLDPKKLQRRKGSMYEVNINADPEQFLHWDKPLSQQSPHVQQALERAVPMDDVRKYFTRDWNPTPDPTGENIHDFMGWSGYQPWQTAEKLRDAGIPGIRYFDQNSRYTTNAEHLGTEQGPDGTWRASLSYAGAPNPALPNTAPPQVLTKSPPMPTKEAADAWASDKVNTSTHNIVAFDPATIDIIRKYGIAGLMAGGAAATAPSLAGAGNGTNQGGGS